MSCPQLTAARSLVRASGTYRTVRRPANPVVQQAGQDVAGNTAATSRNCGCSACQWRKQQSVQPASAVATPYDALCPGCFSISETLFGKYF